MSEAPAVVLAAGLEDEAEALAAQPSFPAAYVARVRAAVRRLDPFPPMPMDIPQALALVTQEARIDVDVPLRTRRRGARVAKLAVKRLTAFYLAYVAEQVGDLGQALVHLGSALADRVDGVEADLGSTQAELADLRRRLAALEGSAKAGPPADGGPPEEPA
ncbi:MAG TPA: hypothetical protein VFW71_03395 [Actinomycetota bacterium]|nr:hypothetical protein [Actinomycetota bacterium]